MPEGTEEFAQDLVKCNRTKDMQMLIRYGAKLTSAILHIAVSYGLTEMTQLLLENNVDVNGTDVDGRSALHVAMHMCIYREGIVPLLLEHGADVHTPQGQYENAFGLARHSNLAIMEILLEKFPDYKLRYKLRKTLAEDGCKCDPADECTCQDRIVPIEQPAA